jgi:hypothetical protein
MRDRAPSLLRDSQVQHGLAFHIEAGTRALQYLTVRWPRRSYARSVIATSPQMNVLIAGGGVDDHAWRYTHVVWKGKRKAIARLSTLA